MELNTYIYLIIAIILIILIFIIKLPKEKKYKQGKKIANTKIVKQTKYYQSLIRKYKKNIFLASLFLIISFISVAILSGRLVEKSYEESNDSSRDIILCMDVSDSTKEINYELVKNMKKIVENLSQEKFGIVAFSTSAYLSLPLTNDYEYINEMLEEYENAYKIINSDYSSYTSTERLKAKSFITSGTTANADDRGYSLIGDGLASCMYDFPDLETETKSRVIILSTDNELYGTPYLTTIEAAKLCKKYNVTVYALSPNSITAIDESNLKKSAELTGGKYYKLNYNNTVSNVVNEINKLERIDSTGEKKVILNDIPNIPFILLIISITLFLYFEKKVLN